MPVGVGSQRTYYRLNGKTAVIETGTKDNRTEYDYIEGHISDIEYREDEWEGEVYHKYQIVFAGEDGEEILQFSAGTVAANGILNSLAHAIEQGGGLGYIHIRPYKPDGARYTAVYMESDGERMEWLSPIEDQPKDHDKREAFFKRFYERIKEKLAEQPEEDPAGFAQAEAQGGEAKQGEPAIDMSDIDGDLPF